MSIESTQLALLEHCFKMMVAPFQAAAILNQDGKVLYLKSFIPQDIGTLKYCFKTIKSYFPLDNEDIIMTNDCYSGGTLPNAFSFVNSFTFSQQRLFLVVRFYQPFLCEPTKDHSQEGVKIPPMPITQKKQIQTPLLQAMGSHPLLGPEFVDNVEITIQNIWKQIKGLNQYLIKSLVPTQKDILQKFMTHTQNELLKTMNEFGHGDAKIELPLSTGEVIKCQFNFDGEGFIFNFSGTSSSQQFFLSEVATLGCCISGVLSLLKRDFIVNENILARVVVNFTGQCFLAAKSPAPVTAGGLVLSSQITNLSQFLANKVLSHRFSSLKNTSPTFLQFHFDSKNWLEVIHAGSSSTPDNEGVNTSPLYDHQLIDQQNTLQKMESIGILKMTKAGFRKDSFGKGKNKGGLGQFREYKILKPCRLTYLVSPQAQFGKDLPPLNAGLGNSLQIHKKNGSKVDLEFGFHKVELETGDSLSILTAGGSGYGKPESESL